MSELHRTGCTWATDRMTDLGPMLCGRMADGPHPDPDRGYLEPLCGRHRAQLAADEAGGAGDVGTSTYRRDR